jgi:hypothetical protein
MPTENASITAFKVWIFPSLVSLVSLLIWNDVNEIKADVKLLMAQSNIDKTRIDNIERQLFKGTSVPFTPVNAFPERQQILALLPENKIKLVKYEF